MQNNASYIKACDCGSNYIATGKPLCPTCTRDKKHKKHVVLVEKRIKRQKAKAEAKRIRAQERRLSKLKQGEYNDC